MQRSSLSNYKHRTSRSLSPCSYRPISRTTNTEDNSPLVSSNMNMRFRSSKESSDLHSTLLTKIDTSELKGIKVSIKRNIPVVITPPPIQRSLDNPEQLIICRKSDEGQKPIFDRDDVIPNVQPKIIEERTITASSSFQRKRSPSSDNSPDRYSDCRKRNSSRDSEDKYRNHRLRSNSRENKHPVRNSKSPKSKNYRSPVSPRSDYKRHRSISPSERHTYESPERGSRSPKRHNKSPRRGRDSRSPRRDKNPKRTRSPKRATRTPRREIKSPRKETRSPRRESRSPRRDHRSPKREYRSPKRHWEEPRSGRSPRRDDRYHKGRSPKRRDDRSPRRTRRSSRSPRDYRREHSNRDRDRDRHEYDRKYSKHHRERSRSRPRPLGYYKPSPSKDLVRARPEVIFPAPEANRLWPRPIRGDILMPKEVMQAGMHWMGPPFIPPPRLPPFMPPPFRPRYPVQPRLQYNSLTSYKLPEKSTPDDAVASSSTKRDDSQKAHTEVKMEEKERNDERKNQGNKEESDK